MLQSATDAEVRNPVILTLRGQGRATVPVSQMSRISQINDFFRKAILTNPVRGGKCLLTRGVHALDADVQMTILMKVKVFDTFTEDNDPYGEHDFGTIEVAGIGKVFWKIDYFKDATLKCGTEDRVKAYRVLTVMLADEY